MDRRSIAVTVFGLFVASGAAAMIGVTALPEASPYFTVLMYGGAVGLVIGLVGLIALFIFQPRPKPKGGSTFAKVSGGGSLLLDENDSTADTFVDAENAEDIVARKNRHSPD